jgi:hypothetical protein
MLETPASRRARVRCLRQQTPKGHNLSEARSFEVGSDRCGIITYSRQVADMRHIGWQFQENQLRFYVTVEDPDLQGTAQCAAREKIVDAEHADFFDHTAVEAILGSDLRAKSYAPGVWLGFSHAADADIRLASPLDLYFRRVLLLGCSHGGHGGASTY